MFLFYWSSPPPNTVHSSPDFTWFIFTLQGVYCQNSINVFIVPTVCTFSPFQIKKQNYYKFLNLIMQLTIWVMYLEKLFHGLYQLWSCITASTSSCIEHALHWSLPVCLNYWISPALVSIYEELSVLACTLDRWKPGCTP